mgnify:CR=1 FL=1
MLVYCVVSSHAGEELVLRYLPSQPVHGAGKQPVPWKHGQCGESGRDGDAEAQPVKYDDRDGKRPGEHEKPHSDYLALVACA